ERTFSVSGSVTFDAMTNAGSIDVRVGGEGTVVVRGTVKRNVSWRGAQVTDAEIARLRAAPPVRGNGNTILVERIADEALWRGVAIDYEIVVPTATKVLLATNSGSVTVSGPREGVRIETGSGAIRLDIADGAADLRSGSGGISVSGTMDALSVQTG